jgi:hypothetical protein
MGVIQALGQYKESAATRAAAAEFVNFVRCLGAAKNCDLKNALAYAQNNRANENVTTILKAAVGAASTSTLGTLFEYEQAVSAFIGQSEGWSCFGNIKPSTHQLPLHAREDLMIQIRALRNGISVLTA